MTTVAEFIERNREQLIEGYTREVGTWEPTAEGLRGGTAPACHALLATVRER